MLHLNNMLCWRRHLGLTKPERTGPAVFRNIYSFILYSAIVLSDLLTSGPYVGAIGTEVLFLSPWEHRNTEKTRTRTIMVNGVSGALPELTALHNWGLFNSGQKDRKSLLSKRRMPLLRLRNGVDVTENQRLPSKFRQIHLIGWIYSLLLR